MSPLRAAVAASLPASAASAMPPDPERAKAVWYGAFGPKGMPPERLDIKPE